VCYADTTNKHRADGFVIKPVSVMSESEGVLFSVPTVVEGKCNDDGTPITTLIEGVHMFFVCALSAFEVVGLEPFTELNIEVMPVFVSAVPTSSTNGQYATVVLGPCDIAHIDPNIVQGVLECDIADAIFRPRDGLLVNTMHDCIQ
jgi:hypothetical protein